MRYRVRFTQEAKEDLIKLYEFLLEKNQGHLYKLSRAP